MRINYKEPYWVKFKWDLSSHNDNQYVTEFNKHDSDVFLDFLQSQKFVISATFKIENTFERDEISMVYGKPGKQMGLSYNTTTQTTAFEYWITNKGGDHFKYFHMKDVTVDDIEKGVTITIVRDGNTLIGYKNFIEINRMEIDGEFVDDYKVPGFFLGCASPQSKEKKHRYHCEVEYHFFTILTNVTDINHIEDLHKTKNGDLINKEYYNEILCLFDFQTINNIGIVYDESKNTNFLEKVPSEFVL